MKSIVFCGSKKVGLECLNWLIEKKYPVKYLIVGEEQYEKYFNSILKKFPKKKVNVISHHDLEQMIRDNLIDHHWIVLSINYRNIFSRDICGKTDIINLHLGLTQYYRGFHSPTHAIIDGRNITGCTLHKVIPKIDSGDIIFQEEIPIYKTDTGYDVYCRVLDVAISMFIKIFPEYYNKPFGCKPQRLGKYKKYKDILEKEITFKGKTGEEIYNFIRAHLFSGYSPPYLYIGDKKYILINENEKH